MQMSFQPPDAAPTASLRRCAIALSTAGLLLSILVGGARADPYASSPYASTWASAQKSSVRLIAAHPDQAGGPWRAGVEVHLDPGAVTYWRTPGGAGVPPVFSFEASTNVANVEVAYPAPRRIDEAGTDAYGYQDAVIFPLRVTPREPDRAMSLALTLAYAVCERICMPAKAMTSLALPARPDPADPENAQKIAGAEAEVPARLTQPERDAKVAIAVEPGSTAPAWRLSLREGSAEDLFAEGPDGWYFETRKTERPNEFLIVQAEKPKAASPAAVPVTLTLTSPRQSYEFGIELDTTTRRGAFP